MTHIMSIKDIYQSIRPTKGQRIYDLVKEAGVDIRYWEVSKKTGLPIDPYVNTYQNSQWKFGGGPQPLVACIWWTEMIPQVDRIVCKGNAKGDSDRMGNLLAEIKGKDATTSQRLTNRIKKARAFDQLMSEAYLRRKPVRVVVLDGILAKDEDSEASKASKRLLDEFDWFVHQYDPFSGEFLLVRNIPMPELVPADPFENAEDPGEDPVLQEFLETAPLSETEKEAIIKTRVGQGWFRNALIKRWKGCAVTLCKDESFLIASHIKPWSMCTTRAERLSPDNGLLLTPNLDKLFDLGLITFDEQNRFGMLVSSRLKYNEKHALAINPNMQLNDRFYEGMKPFMQFHRENIFKK